MRWNEYVLIISLCTLTAAGWLKLVAFACALDRDEPPKDAAKADRVAKTMGGLVLWALLMAFAYDFSNLLSR